MMHAIGLAPAAAAPLVPVAGPPVVPANPYVDFVAGAVEVSGPSSSSNIRGGPAVPRNVLRGGVGKALGELAHTSVDELVHRLVVDRESASGQGGRQILLGTCTRFHDAIFCNPGDPLCCPSRLAP